MFSRKLYYPSFQKTVNFELWDTCGQEKYRSLTQLFYKDSLIAIIVYDITNKKSYKEALNYWYQQVQDKGMKDILIVLCGNKSDLDKDKTVTEEEAKEWANIRHIKYFLVNAKDRNLLTDMFTQVGEAVIKLIEQNGNQVSEDDCDEKEKRSVSMVSQKSNVRHNSFKSEWSYGGRKSIKLQQNKTRRKTTYHNNSKEIVGSSCC